MSTEIVKGERFQEILCYVFLISLCEMLLISAGVLYSVCSLHFYLVCILYPVRSLQSTFCTDWIGIAAFFV